MQRRVKKITLNLNFTFQKTLNSSRELLLQIKEICNVTNTPPPLPCMCVEPIWKYDISRSDKL